MSHIMEGVKIPKVQIERVVGPILGMFIDEVISTTLEEDEVLSGEYVTLCPEFPLRKSSDQDDPNHSTNIDWLMYNKTKNEMVFLELKTTDTTFKSEQLQIYLDLQNKIKFDGASFLISDIKKILSSSKEKGKYKNVLDKLNTDLPNFEQLFLGCKIARVFYLAPEASRFNIEKHLHKDNRFFSFENLAHEIESKFYLEWKIIHDHLIELDGSTQRTRNGETKSTDRKNYDARVNFDEINIQCQKYGDVIEVGFTGGMKALNSANLLELKTRKFKHDLAKNGQGTKLSKNWISGNQFLEAIRQLENSKPIVGMDKKLLQSGRFSLTDAQTQKIENYFAEQSAMYEQAGEDRPDCASVTFTWTPDLGRSVTAHINGSTQGCEIE